MSRPFQTPLVVEIADYELLRVVGRGSYGDVWLARNAVGSLVAVKIVHRAKFDHDRPYEREFEGIRRFEPISRSDPNQVSILHVGRNEGFFYYVMELADAVQLKEEKIPSHRNSARTDPAFRSASECSTQIASYTPRTLKQLLRDRGHLPVAECVEILLSLTGALAHLHAHGLVHRDVKPSNVIFVNGKAKLADIGLVTSVDATRSFVGTEGYLPPEGAGTPQADLYSVGKMLYEMATGCDCKEFPTLPRDIGSRPDRDALAEINAIVIRACAHDPRHRYCSVAALRNELLLLREGGSVKRQRTLLWYWAASKKAVLAAVLLAGIAAALLRNMPDKLYSYPKSTKPEVNNLVQQGHELIRLETPAQFAAAARKFRRAIDLDPTFPPGHIGLYHAYFRLGDSEGLRKTANKLIELAPKSADARLAAAWSEWEDWHFQNALALSRQAAELPALSQEGDAYKHLEYGFFLQSFGDSTNALLQYELAQKVLPWDPIILDHLGQPYLMQHDYVNAERFFRKSIEQQPDHWNGHCFLARTFEQKGEFEKAIPEIEECDRLQGVDEAEIKRRYGALRAALVKGGAIAYWKQKLEETQNASPTKLYFLATLHARLGDKEKAYSVLEKACQQHDLDGPMYDLCWDHDDPKFKEIMHLAGLIR